MNTIVIIEDNHPVRKGLIYTIEKLKDKFEVVGEASNGTEGYALILEKRPQIILTDIRLPGITGLQMIKDVLEVYCPQVIVISAYSEFAYAKEAIDLGVLRYLVKPVDEEELIASLNLAAEKWDHSNAESDGFDRPAERIPAEIDDNTNRYTVKLKQYIKKHYADDITVADIASAMNLSESHLSRIFKHDTGYSINEYRILYKMYMACRFLSDGDTKIQEVAKRIGVENQRYFSFFFKKYTNMTPLEFRDKLLRGVPAAMEVVEKLKGIVE